MAVLVLFAGHILDKFVDKFLTWFLSNFGSTLESILRSFSACRRSIFLLMGFRMLLDCILERSLAFLGLSWEA